jgi:tRNA-dihydrouridine synthase B
MGVARTETRLVLAPLRGISTLIYRQAYGAQFQGIDVAMSPFVPTVHSERINPRVLADVMPDANEGALPLIPQIIGRDAGDIRQMVEAMAGLGYGEVNWNLGCPWPQVAKKKRGSGMLPHPEYIDEVLGEVLPALPCRFSVKVRLGYTDPDELMRLVPVLNRHALSEVTIHPRTGSQMYEGVCDVDRFEQAYEALDHPVVYNGDIRTVTDFARLSARFPKIDRWMLGRGVIADPLLPARIKGLSLPHNEQVIMRRFHDDLLRRFEEVLHGMSQVLGKMKEQWKYMSELFPGQEREIRRLLRTHDMPSYLAHVNRLFQSYREPIS